jgi:hypothetical protein
VIERQDPKSADYRETQIFMIPKPSLEIVAYRSRAPVSLQTNGLRIFPGVHCDDRSQFAALVILSIFPRAAAPFARYVNQGIYTLRNFRSDTAGLPIVVETLQIDPALLGLMNGLL